MYKRDFYEWQKKAIIETYHEFNEKDITTKMIMEARKKTGRGLGDIKGFLNRYIQDTYNYAPKFIHNGF